MPASDYVLDAIEDEDMLEELTTYAIDYAHSVGFVGLCSDRKDALDLTITPPMTLLPSPFPLELFEKAISVQETLNELYFRISMDHDFLVDAYKKVVKADKWVAKQVEMMKRVHAEGIRQKYVLQVQRVDYMAHRGGEEKIELKQIEVNLGPGGPGFAQKMAKVHKKLLQKVENLHYGPIPGLTNATIPARRSIAEALFNAWKLQGDPEAYIVFVFDSSLYPIQHHEQCQFVQFELENAAKKEGFPINVIRMTFEECAKRMHLDSEGDYSLLIDGDKRVSLVYMVYGYLPEHYATEKEWNCLLDMERSTAIVSPNIRLQLTGTKKIQQILAKPGVIETFLPDISHKKIAQLRSTFTGIWALDGDSNETKALIEDAIQNPQNYVLKALRDDGIGNFFDEELAEMLQEMSVQDRSAFILQEKIRPIIVKNYTKRPFIPAQLENVVTELGIFGTCIHSAENGDGKTLWNRVDASVSKTKGHNFNQGGIGEGSGVIDSLVLLPKADFSLTKD